MSVKPPMTMQPQRDNVPAGTYAIRVGEQQQIWRLRESDDPFSDELEWEKVGERSINSVPKSNYDGGRWEADDDGDIWFYVEDIDPEKEPDRKKTQFDETAPYALQVQDPDGRTYSITGSRQSDVFAESIEYLIQKYSLDQVLRNQGDLPYVPGFKNAYLNDEPRHPNGEEMKRSKEIAGGKYYVSSQPTKEQKIETLEYFADAVDATVEFINGWDD